MNGLGYYVAIIAGGSVELALDPVDIILGLLIGAAAPRWWQRIMAAVLLAAIVTIAIRASSDFESDSPLWWVITCRSIAITAWAVVGWMGRLISRRLQPA